MKMLRDNGFRLLEELCKVRMADLSTSKIMQGRFEINTGA
jgi:hypothetical protein